MSDISITFTPWELIQIGAGLLFMGLAIPLLIAIGLIMLRPAWRARRWARRAAWIMLGVLLGLGGVGQTLLRTAWSEMADHPSET